MQFLQRLQRADHIRQPARVEQIAIQMMSFTVIAKIEAHDLEAPLEQLLGDRKNVERVRASLPTMQNDHGPAVADRRLRHKGLQAHAVATVEQHLLLRGNERSRAPRDAATTRYRARQYRLHM